jgi:hypothetical protein
MDLSERRLFTLPMIGVFIIIFAGATLARLPAAVMLPYLAKGGVEAAGADGTIWNARFSALSFQAMRFDTGSYQLKPMGFINGTNIGNFSLVGDIAAMTGKLQMIDERRIYLTDLTVNAQYPLTVRRLKLTPRIGMQTEELVISQDGQCADGEIALSLQLNNPLLKSFLPQADLWDGSASCDNGRASFLLNPRDNGLIAVIRGKLNGNRYQADIDLSLEDGFDESDGLKAALKSAGFKKRQGRWRAEVKGIL